MPDYTKSAKRKALNNLLREADRYAFKGSMHPEDHAEIDSGYLKAINRLETILDLPLTKELPE